MILELIELGGIVVAYGFGLARGRRRRGSTESSVAPICGCTHHLALHDPETGQCNWRTSVYPETQLGLLVGQYVLAREKFFQDPDAVCAWLLERERTQADASRWRVESVTFEDGEFVVTKINLAMEALTKVDLPGVPKAPASLAETQSTVDFLGLFIQAAIQHDGQTRVAKGADNG